MPVAMAVIMTYQILILVLKPYAKRGDDGYVTADAIRLRLTELMHCACAYRLHLLANVELYLLVLCGYIFWISTYSLLGV